MVINRGSPMPPYVVSVGELVSTDVLLDPDDPTRAIVGNATSHFVGFHIGPAVINNVHLSEKCEGRPCVVHNPSDHHMRTGELIWRDDKGCFERRCPHGIGHPDPDDIGPCVHHGCDGCCGVPA